MSELEDATRLANRVLDKPFIDPDGDICMLARQFLKARERIAHLEKVIAHLETDRRGSLTSGGDDVGQVE